MEKLLILYTSDEAATYRTGLSGWVSRNGRFWGENEGSARWDGCTHVICGCGQPVEKGRTMCQVCRTEAETKRYNALKRKQWDGETPLCIYNDDHYFWNEDDLIYYCEEHDCSLSDLQLVFCEPAFAKEINPEDIYGGDLPEEGEVPQILLDAFEELNRVIRESRIILSWSPGKFAVTFDEE